MFVATVSECDEPASAAGVSGDRLDCDLSARAKRCRLSPSLAQSPSQRCFSDPGQPCRHANFRAPSGTMRAGTPTSAL